MMHCPSLKSLGQLLAEALPEEEMLGMREHLARCAQCQVLFDRLIERPEWKRHAFMCWPQRASSGSLHPRLAMEPALVGLLEKLHATPSPDAFELADTAEELDTSLGFLGVPLHPGDLGTLGSYRVLGELGRGGMGIVLRAYDLELRRTVALKVLPPDRADARARARFVREARAVASIADDHVVPVYAVDNPPKGPPYLVMQYVEGLTLRERIKAEGRLAAHEAARICLQAAKGLATAHGAGLVHRDIKPGNIMLESATDRARIMDFGLARMTTLPGGTTQEGTVPGTPEYMSPEQVRAPERIDARTDVYSLGVTLYEALTGEVPFRGVAQMVLQQILNDEPRPPRRINDQIPRDLETICLRCLQKEPGKRYASANGLAEDLRRFLAGEPIQARPVRAWERAVKWARRRPAVAALLALVVGITALGFGLVTWQWRRAESASEDLATKARQLAVQAKKLESKNYVGNIQQAALELTMSNSGRAEELLDECPQHLRGWEWHYLKRERHAPLVPLPLGRRLSGGKGFDFAFSPDCRLLATPSGKKDIKVWAASTGQEVLTLRGHQDRVLRLAFSPHGRFLASTSEDKTVRVWDTITGREAFTLCDHGRPVHGVAFNPDGRLLASASFDQSIKLWDAATGAPLHTFPASFTRNVFVTVAFSPDGRLLAAPGVGNTAKVWHVDNGQEVATLRGHADQVFSVAFSPDGRRLITEGWEGAIKVWDLPSSGAPGVSSAILLTPRFSVDDLSHAAWCVALSADGRRLAVAGTVVDETVRVYDALSGEKVFALRGHSARAVSVAFSPDGRRLASGGQDKTVRLWDTETGQEMLTLRGHTDLVGHVLFDPSGRRLASSSDDGTVRIWDAAPLEEDPRIRTLHGHAGMVHGVAFSPDSRYLASAGGDQTVKVWEATAGREVLALHGHGGPVNSVAFRPDGRHLASASEDKTVKLWNIEQWQAGGVNPLILTLTDFRGGVRCVAFSPDDQRLATSDNTETVQVWEAATGRKVLPALRGHEGYVKFVAFSHDGKLLATGSVDGTVKLWDATTGQAIHTFEYNTRVTSMALSSDSRLLASGDADRMVKVWELATRKEMFALAGHTNYLTALAFSRDGRRLASASGQEIIVWDSASGQEITRLHGLLGTIRGVTFSPDGQRLAACGGYKAKGEIKIWDARLWEKSP
jgi:WD40 repeat protein